MKSAYLSAVLLLLPFALHAQHDAQRDAVIALARGDAKRYENAFLNPRNDAGLEETRMVELLFLLSQDKVDEAIRAAREGLEAGMNPARFWAGSGEPLTKLRAHPRFGDLPGIAEVGPLIHGPMIGNVTDTSASIWVRGKADRNRTWSASCFESGEADSAGGGTGTGGEYVSTSEDDFTVVLTMEGLQPGTAYSGTVQCEGEDVGSFSFRTRATAGTGSKFKIAFGGGAGFVPEYHGMWDVIASHEPDALLMLGDNVYIDDPTHEVTQHYCYYRRQSEPGWRSLVSKVPVYSIYDDHDFGDNDCMPGPEIEKPAWKRPVLEVFRQNWVNPGYGGGQDNPGCWYDFVIGDVQLFLIDGRYYRHRDTGSMLGEFQRKWLLEGLKNSNATFKLIVSPVPFTPGIKPGSKDPWDGYPEEREEIFSFIESEGIEGVFLVAADRHRTDLRRIDRDAGYPIYEFMSSRLTNRHTHSVVQTPGLVWGYRDTCSFGLMEFDTTAEDPQVTFRCIDIEGTEHHSFVLKRSMIE